MTMLSIRAFFLAAIAVCTILQSNAQGNPWDIEFKRVWEGRNIFDAEMPFPKDVKFLPVAHYSAEVTALPFEMRVVDGKGNSIVSFSAPTNVAPPFTMHLGFGGRSRVVVYVTKDGKTSFARLDRLPKSFDPRKKECCRSLSVVSVCGGKTVPARCALSAGIGQADVRFVTRGRQGQPYMENGRMFFTFTLRYHNNGCGVASLDPRHPERGVKFEGVLFFDYGDGLLRNDLAPHIFFDDESGEWRGWACNFSTSADEGAKGRAPGGVNVVWSRFSPLRGLSIMNAKPLGLPSMNEDPCGIWDAKAKKWRLLVSAFTPKGIKAQMYESNRWDGGFIPITGTVPEDSTGTTIASCGGKFYCFSGSVDRKYYVYSYPFLKKLGTLKMTPTPWVADAKGWPHGRGWPTFIELPEGYPHKYLLLTMDRENFPGVPKPNWTYGGLHLYVGE